MKYNVETRDDAVIITFSGKLMGGPDAENLSDLVKKNLGNGVLHFVFDMSQVSWMNSSGLGILIGVLKPINEAGGQMKLAGVTEKVKSILMITRLMTIFKTYDTLADALASMD